MEAYIKAGNFGPKFFSHVNQCNPAHILSLGLSSPYSFGVGCSAQYPFFDPLSSPCSFWAIQPRGYPAHILLGYPAHVLFGLSSPGAIQPIFYWAIQPTMLQPATATFLQL